MDEEVSWSHINDINQLIDSNNGKYDRKMIERKRKSFHAYTDRVNNCTR